MKRMKSAKLAMTIFCGVLAATLFACVSQNKTMTQMDNDNRQVAQSIAPEQSAEDKMEQNFQEIFNSENPTTEAITRVDKLFTLRLKSNLFIDSFSADLDAKLKFKAANPKAVGAEPLQSEEYKKLLKAWNLNERYTHEIAYLYGRALDLRTDLNQPEETRKKARKLFKEVSAHFTATKDLQRVEFQPLMSELKDIYSAHIIKFVADLEAKNADGSKTKDIAAVSRVPEFNNRIVLDAGKMTKASKNLASNKQVMAALKKARNTNSVDADLAEIADPVFESRTPQSDVADLACADGKKLCISTGESGNIVGAVFPKGVWAFTYDDGPASQSTGDIMDLFIKHKDAINPVGKATFFWTANNVLLNGNKWIKKAIDNGFPIENHSYSHADLNRQDTDRVKQINTSNKVIEDAVRKVDPGYKIQYFRCPYGSCYAPKIPVVRQMIADQKQIHAYWRIDSLDWKLLNSEKVAELVKKQIALMDHGVILMHDVHPTTVGATKLVLDWLKDQNNNKGKTYKMVTIPEAVELVNSKK